MLLIIIYQLVPVIASEVKQSDFDRIILFIIMQIKPLKDCNVTLSPRNDTMQKICILKRDSTFDKIVQSVNKVNRKISFSSSFQTFIRWNRLSLPGIIFPAEFPEIDDRFPDLLIPVACINPHTVSVFLPD